MGKKIRGGKQPKKAYLIYITDGETEQIYFKQFKKYEDIKVKIAPELSNARGYKPKEIKDSILQKLNAGYDEVFWLLDLDKFVSDGHLKSLKSVIKTLKKEGVRIVVNNPCLEVWFLLHFKDTTKEFRDCREVIENLKKHINDYEKSKKYFYSKQIYTSLKDRQEQAIYNCKKLKRNPLSSNNNLYTPYAKIYEIIEFFLGLEEE